MHIKATCQFYTDRVFVVSFCALLALENNVNQTQTFLSHNPCNLLLKPINSDFFESQQQHLLDLNTFTQQGGSSYYSPSTQTPAKRPKLACTLCNRTFNSQVSNKLFINFVFEVIGLYIQKNLGNASSEAT